MKRLWSRRVALLLASALPLLAEEDSSGPTATVLPEELEMDLIHTVSREEQDEEADSSSSGAPPLIHVAQHLEDEADAATEFKCDDEINTIRKPPEQDFYKEMMGHPRAVRMTDEAQRRALTHTRWEPSDWMVEDDDMSFFPFFAFDDDDTSESFMGECSSGLLTEFTNVTNGTVSSTNISEGGDSVNGEESEETSVAATEAATSSEEQAENFVEDDKNMTREDNSVLFGEDGELAQKPLLNATEPVDELSDDSDDAATNQTNTSTATAVPVPDETEPKEDEESKVKHVAVDYASKAAGALILDSSPNFQGASNLLQKDNDKYAIVPCDEENKYVVIGLSEDILVKQVVLSNFERYSSHMKEIHLSGSATTALGSKDWVDLGTYLTAPVSGGIRKQTFDLTEPTWARYLRFEFLSHYGDEYYCTVSQISVHGSTMVQGFHEQWAELESEDDEEEESEEKIAGADSTTSQSSDAATGNDSDDGESSTALDPENENESLFNNDETDAVESPQQSEGVTRRFPPALKGCFSQSDPECPGGRDFEERMLRFLSGNSSDLEADDALSSASLTLSASRPATNQSFFEAEHLRLKHWSGSLKPDLMSGRPAILSTAVTTEDFGVGTVSDTLEQPSPVVKRIKDIIRQTADAVNIEGIGHSLLRSLPVVSEIVDDEGADSSTTTSLKKTDEVPEDSSEKVQQEMPQHTVSKPDTVAQEEELDVEPDDHISKSLSKILRRLPSSKCLEKLDFTGFKKDFLAQRNKGSGQPEKNHAAGVPMEPIFKKLTDEIKTLQANVAVHDQFARESILCYQSVMLEILVEMESLRTVQDSRISKLENGFYLGPWLATFWRLLTGFLLWAFRPAGVVLSAIVGSRTELANAVTSFVILLILLASFIRNRKRSKTLAWLSWKTATRRNKSDRSMNHPQPLSKGAETPPPPIKKQGDSVATVSPEHSERSIASFSSHGGSSKSSSKKKALAARLSNFRRSVR